jgi:RNA polymerase sigma-70 factor (ECF subfamily)
LSGTAAIPGAWKRVAATAGACTGVLEDRLVWLTAAEASEGRRVTPLDSFLRDVERRALVTAQLATRDREEALDIVQDAMLAFVDRYASHDAQEWAPLFHRVLQNRIRDWGRRQQVRRRWRVWLSRDDEDEADPIESAPDPAGRTPEQEVALARAGDALLAAVEDLPARQREAFLLRTWEGLDVAETALAMGCSEGSVKTHLWRALQQLREKLEGHWQ